MNAHPQIFEIASGVWRMCEMASNRPPLPVELRAAALEVRKARFVFAVSSDEEHVELCVSQDGLTVDMGARAHNYLLLTLARQRLKDKADGFAEASCGWICADDLAHDPMMIPERLNMDVFRIRKQFAERGIVEAAAVIERRPRARQLRIGTARLSIVRL